MRLASFLGMLLLLNTGIAFGEECDSILSEKLLDESNVIDDQSASNALASSYCQKSYNEASKDGSFSAGVKYKFFSAKVKKSQSEYNKFKSENCGSLSKSQQSQRYYLNSQKALKETAVNAWRDCKLNSTGLSCFLRPSAGKEDVILALRFKSPGDSKATIKRATIVNGTNLSDPNLGSKIYDVGEVVEGTDEIIVGINDVNKALKITLKAEYDGVSQSCFVDFLDKKIEVPVVESVDEGPSEADFSINGKWCKFPPNVDPDVFQPQFYTIMELFGDTIKSKSYRLSGEQYGDSGEDSYSRSGNEITVTEGPHNGASIVRKWIIKSDDSFVETYKFYSINAKQSSRPSGWLYKRCD